MEEQFKLSIGFKYNGQDIFEAQIAETGGEAEKIYKQSKKEHRPIGCSRLQLNAQASRTATKVGEAEA